MTMHSSRRHYSRAKRLHTTTAFRDFHSLRTPGRKVLGGRSSKCQQPSSCVSEPCHDSEQNESIAPTFDLQALRRIALDMAKAGDYDESLALFDQLLQQNPLSATDYNNRGLVYFRNRQHDEALDDFNMAISLNPDLDSVYNNRANYYAHHGHLLEAILDYDRAIELNPFNVRAWINQGITFRDMEMYDRAIECFDSALNFSRLEEHVYLERGRTYHLRGDWNCAIADYQRAKICFYASSTSLSRRSIRLLSQIEGWIDELLSPLEFYPEQA
ncbi:MAG: tetratricopeptide repeat protein [Cyanobacteria bacterium P01_F01_bin.150]